MSPVELYTKEERKANGIFYTPKFISDFLTKKAIQYSGTESFTSILDPACGDSALLRSMLSAISHDANIKPQIVGVDRDFNAVLSSAAHFNKSFAGDIRSNFIEADGLFPVKGKSRVHGWEILRQNLNIRKGFDLILSNPPWGANLNVYDSLTLNYNFQLAKGQFDIYDLFVECILDNLALDGTYGLILPDSIFSQEQSGLRKLLTNNSTLFLIARLGEKVFPEINRACVVIVGKKTKANEEHQVDCFRLSADFRKKILSNALTLEQAEQQLSHKVPQIRFTENPEYIFDIDLKTQEQGTFEKIKQGHTILKRFVLNTRGAEISKKGRVCQCPVCFHWMPNPKTARPKCNNCKVEFELETAIQERIIVDHDGVGYLKMKVGEDLYRFTSISKTWINTLKPGINYKNLDIYSGDKIIVRKTGIGITASMDYESSITNQVVYILKLRPEYKSRMSLEFMLAVLNSRAMTYYLIKKFGESEWKSHPYLTQSILINLPFPNIDFSIPEHTKLINRATEMLRGEIRHSTEKNISKPLDIYLERVIAYFFGLNEADYQVIYEALKSSAQLLPIKRLLNCTKNEIFQVNGF